MYKSIDNGKMQMVRAGRGGAGGSVLVYYMVCIDVSVIYKYLT